MRTILFGLLALIALAAAVLGGRAMMEPPPNLAMDQRASSEAGPPDFFTNPQPSLLALGLAIDEAALVRLIEKAAPTHLEGRVDNPAPAPIENDELRWRMAAQAVRAQMAEGALTIEADIGGDALLFGDLAANLGGDVGRLLGALTGSSGDGPSLPIQAPVRLEGAVQITASPELQPNWRVTPAVTGAITLEEARAEVGALGEIDLAGAAQAAIDSRASSLIEAAANRAAEDDSMEKAAAFAWALSQGPHQLEQAGAPIQLLPAPEGFVASQPRFENGDARLRLGFRTGLKAILGGDEAPAPASAGPLPPLELVEPATLERFSSHPVVKLDWETLATLAQTQLEERWLPLGQNGQPSYGEARVDALSIAPSGEAIRARAEVTLRGQAASLLGERATLFAEATPSLSEDGAALALRDVKANLAPASGVGDALWRAASPWAQPYLANGFLAPFDTIAPQVEAAIEQALPLVAGAAGWEIETDLALARLAPSRIAVREEALYVEIAGEGALDVRVVDAPIARMSPGQL